MKKRRRVGASEREKGKERGDAGTEGGDGVSAGKRQAGTRGAAQWG